MQCRGLVKYPARAASLMAALFAYDPRKLASASICS
jgi:hypothetical protein